MNKPTAYLSVLCAGLLAVGAAQAQSASPAASTDGPPAAGEASNQTQGVPNAKTTNSPFTEKPVTSEQLSPSPNVMGAAAATTPVPGKAGEATTTVQGKPNANPLPAAAKSREQVVSELLARRGVYHAALQSRNLAMFQ